MRGAGRLPDSAGVRRRDHVKHDDLAAARAEGVVGVRHGRRRGGAALERDDEAPQAGERTHARPHQQERRRQAAEQRLGDVAEAGRPAAPARPHPQGDGVEPGFGAHSGDQRRRLALEIDDLEVRPRRRCPAPSRRARARARTRASQPAALARLRALATQLCVRERVGDGDEQRHRPTSCQGCPSRRRRRCLPGCELALLAVQHHAHAAPSRRLYPPRRRPCGGAGRTPRARRGTTAARAPASRPAAGAGR